MIAIIGPGALGIGVAGFLAEIGEPVAFIGRKGPEAINAEWDFQGKRLRIASPVIHSSQIKEEVDLVFITVKAYDLAAAITAHLRLFKKAIPIVSLCNGAVFTIMSAASQRDPNYLWRLGSVNLGVKETVANHFALSNPDGTVSWGEPGGKPSAFEESLFKKIARFKWLEDPTAALRRKWLFNTVINTLCAAGDLAQNRDLLKDHGSIGNVFEEAYDLGVKEWGPWSDGKEVLRKAMLALIEKTGSNENSMRRDLRLKNHTEVDFLSGVANGDKNFPQLNRLTAQIKALSTP
jgi:2-dehydropantoate 2-reductase